MDDSMFDDEIKNAYTCLMMKLFDTYIASSKFADNEDRLILRKIFQLLQLAAHLLLALKPRNRLASWLQNVPELRGLDWVLKHLQGLHLSLPFKLCDYPLFLFKSPVLVKRCKRACTS